MADALLRDSLDSARLARGASTGRDALAAELIAGMVRELEVPRARLEQMMSAAAEDDNTSPSTLRDAVLAALDRPDKASRDPSGSTHTPK